MVRITAVITSELKKRVWDSPLQLLVAGIILYYVAMVLGTGYACGPGNSDVTRGIFRCSYSEMQMIYKVFIVIGIGMASLCLGRAVSVLEKRQCEAE